jgi:hypothetical protein
LRSLRGGGDQGGEGGCGEVTVQGEPDEQAVRAAITEEGYGVEGAA